MGLGFTETLTLDKLAPWLRGKVQAVQNYNFDRVLKAAGVILESATKANFDWGRSPDRIPWAPLSKPRKRNQKAVLAGFLGANAGLPLRDTGALMASLTSSGARHIEERTAHSLEWGTSVDYAAYHQLGTKTIPARPFLGLNDEVTGDLAQLLADELTGDNGPL